MQNMTRTLSLLLMLLSLCVTACADSPSADEGRLLDRTLDSRQHVTNTVTVNLNGSKPTRLVVIIPVPQSTIYQEISNVKIPKDATMLTVPGGCARYIRFIFKGGDLNWETKSFQYEFNVTLSKTRTDLGRIGRVPAYDTESQVYRAYTGKCGDIIDPDNSDIKTIGDKLWEKSPDVLSYARNCYLYVASNYAFESPKTGMHPVADLIKARGGDCANLSTIFISLLRHKGIPARHVVGLGITGAHHVWADFFVEKWGWVPVDESAKVVDPKGDYFGDVSRNSKHVIMSLGANPLVDYGDGVLRTVPILQSRYWLSWRSGGEKITCTQTVTSSPIR
jgi:hypothetical protein